MEGIKWEDTPGRSDYVVNGNPVGRIYRLIDGDYCAVVYPPGREGEEVADNVSETDAKKAVESYWEKAKTAGSLESAKQFLNQTAGKDQSG